MITVWDSQVVPIVTQLKEDLSIISEADDGVKTLKRKLAAQVEARLGDFESEEKYAVAAIIDPRFVVLTQALTFFSLYKLNNCVLFLY